MTEQPGIVRHDGHDPALLCRPAGNGLCELAPPWLQDVQRKLEAEIIGDVENWRPTGLDGTR